MVSANVALGIIKDKAYADMSSGKIFKMMMYNVLSAFRILPVDQDGVLAFTHSKTNGYYIAYNPKMFDDSNKLAFVLMHESLHILFGHMNVEYDDEMKLNHDIVNIAMDAQINSYIVSDTDGSCDYVSPVTKPEEGKGYSGLTDIHQHNDWKTIYKYIKEHSKVVEVSDGTLKLENKDGSDSSDSNSSSSQESQSEDSKNNSNSKSKSSGSKDNKNTNPLATRKGSDVANLGSEGTKDKTTLSKDDVKKIREIALTAINKVDRMRGTNPGTSAAQLGIKVDVIQPIKLKSEWNKYLSKAIGGGLNKHYRKISSWNRPNRRFGEGVPGYKSSRYQKVGILVDVSGSMSSSVPTAISAIAKIMSFTSGIDRLLLWDTQLEGEYKNINLHKLKNVKFDACGGTALRGGIMMLKSDTTQMVVLLTDLEVDSEDIDAINELSKRKQVIIGVFNGRGRDGLDPSVKVISIDNLNKEE